VKSTQAIVDFKDRYETMDNVTPAEEELDT